MKKLLILVFSLVAASAKAQQSVPDTTELETVSVVVDPFDEQATRTKDGYYIDKYVADIDHATAQKVNGKKIRVTGKLIVMTDPNDPPKYDQKGNVIISQGRGGTTYRIIAPKVKVLKK